MARKGELLGPRPGPGPSRAQRRGSTGSGVPEEVPLGAAQLLAATFEPALQSAVGVEQRQQADAFAFAGEDGRLIGGVRFGADIRSGAIGTEGRRRLDQPKSFLEMIEQSGPLGAHGEGLDRDADTGLTPGFLQRGEHVERFLDVGGIAP
jgi:hypothetical protein